MTIIYTPDDPAARASTLALQALGWVLEDERRAQRFLDLTGLTPDTLRAGIASMDTHRAVLDFLSSHEPDLVGAAHALDIDPAELANAKEQLSR